MNSPQKQALIDELKERLRLISRNCEAAIAYIESDRLAQLSAVNIPDIRVQRVIGQLQQMQEGDNNGNP